MSTAPAIWKMSFSQASRPLRPRWRGGGGELEPVVHAAQGPEPQEHEDRFLDERIVELGPQQRRQDRRGQDDQAAHRRGVGLLLGQLVEGGVVELRPVADLLPHQPADDSRTDQQRDRQAGQDRHDRTEQDVLIRVEMQRIGEEAAEMSKQMRRSSRVQWMNDH